MKFTRMF